MKHHKIPREDFHADRFLTFFLYSFIAAISHRLRPEKKKKEKIIIF